MAIVNVNENQLKDLQNKFLSPSDPIRSVEFLLGRESALRDIRRHLSTKGRHVFIYGDRGVGKTSLAHTAAVTFHPSGSSPVRVAGAVGETFETIISSVVSRMYSRNGTSRKTEIQGQFSLGVLSIKMKQEIDRGEAPEIGSLNDAINALGYVSSCYSDTPVVVLDEFDRLGSREDKTKFAELIKQISDQEINVKFIFCGIGESMHELLGAHYSSGRAITAIELPRLDHESLIKIVTNAVESVGLSVDNETSSRIAILSDGFPYFAHLVTEKMIWQAFDDEDYITEISLEHFGSGVDAAVTNAMALLKETYERAKKKYSDSYEEVLWALVDRRTLTRQSKSIYDESYVRIMNEVNRKPLELKKFYTRLNSLKRESHGRILNSPRSGWYEFSENMVRGYVKLKAAENRIDLGIDHHNSVAPVNKRLALDFYS